MADYFTNISFEFEMPSAEAAQQAVELIAEIEAYVEDPEGKEGFEGFEGWAGDWCTIGANVEAEGERVWIYDDCGCPELEFLVACLGEVLRRFHPQGCIGFEWGSGCSKHRLDAFGGGAVFVTAESAEWRHLGSWVEEKKKAHEEERSGEEASSSEYCCEVCGGGAVEICLPAFFEANSATFEHVSTDYEAEALSWYCRDCEKSVAVQIADGRVDAGRWNREYLVG